MKLKHILIIIAFVLTIGLGTVISNAAGTSISASSTEVEVGTPVTINVSVTAASWEISISGKGVSGDTFVGYTEQLDEKTTNKNYTLDTSKAGTYTISLTGTITDENGKTDKVSKEVTVEVKEPVVNPTPDPEPENPGTTTEPDNKPSEPTTPNGGTTTEEKKSSEARLKNLGIEPNDFKGFKSNTLEYSVTVPNEVSEVKVYATARDSKAKIEGTGKISLKEGENIAKVEVTAEDGKTKKTYTIKITREKSAVVEQPTEEPQKPEETQKPEEQPEEELGLSELTIKDITMDPKFNPKKYEYTIGIKEDISSLEIQAKANDEKATVEIIGNENLKQGENIITILVTNSESGESATYQIIVNKNVKEEVVGSTFGTKQKILIGVAIALVVIIIVAIILKIKLSKKDDEEEIEFPGADELDKALAEHQELTDDTWDNFGNFNNNDEQENEDDFINNMYLKNTNEIRTNKESKGQLDKYWERMQNENNTENYDDDKYSRKRGKHF